MTAGMRQSTFRDAVRDAIAEEMARDPSVILIGEDVGPAGGVFKQTEGLHRQFGSQRVIDTPISESGFVGLAIGAAMTGSRPIVEVMFGDFLTLALDQLVNQAAKVHWMSNGKFRVPMVVRCAVGVGGSTGPQHSQSFHAWCAHVPGLKVVFASDPEGAKALMKAAIRDDNPVVFFEDRMSYGQRGPVGTGETVAPLGAAATRRPGLHATVIAVGRMVTLALEAAAHLAEQGKEIEVIDIQSLSPLDTATCVASVKRTNRALVLDCAPLSFGVGAEIAARLQHDAFDWLDAPVARLGASEHPTPFAPAAEADVLPDVERIANALSRLIGTVPPGDGS